MSSVCADAVESTSQCSHAKQVEMLCAYTQVCPLCVHMYTLSHACCARRRALGSVYVCACSVYARARAVCVPVRLRVLLCPCSCVSVCACVCALYFCVSCGYLCAYVHCVCVCEYVRACTRALVHDYAVLRARIILFLVAQHSTIRTSCVCVRVAG